MFLLKNIKKILKKRNCMKVQTTFEIWSTKTISTTQARQRPQEHNAHSKHTPKEIDVL